MRSRRSRTSWGLQLHVVLQILKVFFFVLGVLSLVYALFIAVGVSRQYNLDFLLVLPVISTIGLAILGDILPLALLFASALVYGRLVADREIMAMKSFGVSYGQLLLPVVLLGGVLLPIGFFINGYVVPEMRHQKRNIGTLLLAQLRYLGEGWNKDLPFGDMNLWIKHHDGAKLQGIFISSQNPDAQDLLGKDVAKRLNPTLGKPAYLYAESARILFPEDVAEEAAARGESAGEANQFAERESMSVVFELENVSVFLKNEIIAKETSNFHQRMHFGRLRRKYDPAQVTVRRRRHESNREVSRQMNLVRHKKDELSKEHYHVLRTELHGRYALTLSVFLFPLLAAVVALFLNSEDRLKPFFVSILVVPSIFYSLAMLGRMLGRSGASAPLTMELGNLALALLSLIGFFFLQKRLIR